MMEFMKMKYTGEQVLDKAKKVLKDLNPHEFYKKMIERLEKIERKEIEITDWDKRFYTHKLREYERYQNLGIKDGFETDYDLYNDAHTATLEDFKLSEFDINGVDNIYHPSIPEIDFHF